MKRLVHAILLCLLAITWLESKLEHTFWQDEAMQELLEKAEGIEPNDDRETLFAQLVNEQAQAQNGSMRSTSLHDRITQKTLQQEFTNLALDKKFYSYLWNAQDGSILAMSAVGLDGQPYFANSFLLGFVPFKTTNAWQPLALLSMRKTYMFDHDQYGALYVDVWQNSKQAYAHSHGDCEDHALLLTDWLIGLGFDARVVVGETSAGEGHAWVILFTDSGDYVLEATSKRAPKSINDFLRVERAIHYYPQIQFNRESLWENTGSVLTTNYKDSKWKLRSRFARDVSG